MKRVLTYLAALIMIICMSMLAGMSDYRELEHEALIAGIAVDRGTELEYLVTAEIVGIPQGGGNGADVVARTISAQGQTVTDALNTMAANSSKTLSLRHCSLILISEQIAREDGLLRPLDVILQQNQLKLSTYAVIAKGTSAASFLKQQSNIYPICAYDIVETLKVNANQLHALPLIPFYQLYNQIQSRRTAPVLPVISTASSQDSEGFSLYGCALFASDRLQCFLDQTATNTYLLLTQPRKGGTINTVTEQGTQQSYRIVRARPTLCHSYQDDTLTLWVDIDLEIEQDTTVPINQTQVFANAQFLIEHLRDAYELDLLGFSDAIYRHDPQLWRQLQGDWNTVWRTVPINVHGSITCKPTAQSRMQKEAST